MKINDKANNCMNHPKVTIITPFLNREQFLQETIDSVLNQTYQNWELLLVDDGSTDRSTQIAINNANNYPDNIFYLSHKNHRNQGPSLSRNLGGGHSTGELILYLDSDDVILPEKLERQVKTLNKNKKSKAVFGETLFWFSWNNQPIEGLTDFVWKPWERYEVEPNNLISPPILLRKLILTDNMPCLHSFLIKKEIVDFIGGWDEGFKYSSEDKAFLVKLFLHASIFVSTDCYEKYRQHNQSNYQMVVKTGKDLPARVYFIDWAKRYLLENNFYDPIIEEHFIRILRPYISPGDPDSVNLPLPVGEKNFGDLHRLTPVSREWGFDRGRPIWEQGQPIDLFYSELFLQKYSADIKGKLLIISNTYYSEIFSKIIAKYIKKDKPLNRSFDQDFSFSTVLTGEEKIPHQELDCLIIFETLCSIYDIHTAVQNAFSSLNPGGVLLAILPGIRQTSISEIDIQEDYWRFTDSSVKILFGCFFGEENIIVETFGNVLSASAFLFGLESNELNIQELDFIDPEYQVIITVRAVKIDNSKNSFSIHQKSKKELENELEKIYKSWWWILVAKIKYNWLKLTHKIHQTSKVEIENKQ